MSSVAHESFDGALVVKTLGLEEPRGRSAWRRQPATLRRRADRGRPPARQLRAGARRPPQPRNARRSWRSGPGGSPRVRSRPATSSRRWPCSASSLSRCASSGSCSRSCPGRWSRTIASRGVLRAPRPCAPGAMRTTRCPPVRSRSRCPSCGSRYGDDVVLDGLSSRIEPGEVVALVGATGSGKTHAVHAAHRAGPAR